MKKVITTVGTSLFTNYMKEESKTELGDTYKPEAEGEDGLYGNLEDVTFPIPTAKKCDYDNLKSIIKECWLNKERQNASAEIQSLICIQDKFSCPVEVHLVASQTALSNLASDLIEYYFNDLLNNENIKIIKEDYVINGLRVDEVEIFQNEGLLNLFNKINNIIIDDTYSAYFAINITGGYKASIPFMTILSQINNIDIFYIYENTGKLIRIPPLPLKINYGFIAEYYHIFEKLDSGVTSVWNDFKMKHSLPDLFDSLIETINEDNDSLSSLSSIGKFLFSNFKNNIIVEIEKSCALKNENQGNKRQIFDAIKELYNRLLEHISYNQIENEKQLNQYINQLGDKNDLRHGTNPSENIFIFKSTDIVQIRIVYQPKWVKKALIIRLFDFKRGQFNHQRYIEEFGMQFNNKNDFDFSTITIKKN